MLLTSLPPDVLTRVVMFLNGPDQDNALLANKTFKQPIQRARLAWAQELARRPQRFTDERFPTRLELERFGIGHPNMNAVVATLAPLLIGPVAPRTLRANAQAQARLQSLRDENGHPALTGSAEVASALHGREHFVVSASFGAHDEEELYEGTLVDGERNGLGYLQRCTRRYEGHWVNDLAHGKGIEIDDDGLRYEGEFMADERHGQGKLTLPDGTTCEGSFEDGFPHGYAVMTHPNGNRYEGQFHDGSMHGRGRLQGPDGACSDGFFEQGNFVKGTSLRSDGSCYVGELRNGLCWGYGSYVDVDGVRYEGRYEAGLQQGHGKLASPDGYVYEGQFLRGLQHGHGVSSGPDGGRYIGNFHHGVPNGRGTFRTSNQRYVGLFQNGLFHGTGKLVIGDWRYEGKFKHGYPHGSGIAHSANGERYAGTFHFGTPHGRGELTRPDGSVVRARYRWGMRVAAHEPPAHERRRASAADRVQSFK